MTVKDDKPPGIFRKRCQKRLKKRIQVWVIRNRNQTYIEALPFVEMGRMKDHEPQTNLMFLAMNGNPPLSGARGGIVFRFKSAR